MKPLENNILKFLRSYHIPIATAGANVKRGNVNIRCPLCHNDPSEHMGINPATGEYGCWRNKRHRGKNFARLIQVIAHCSFEEARRILGADTLEVGELQALANRVLGVKVSQEPGKTVVGGVKKLSIPREFKPIVNSDYGIAFFDYLRHRGFINTKEIIQQYDLRYALVGDFKMRVIFPIYYMGELVTWVGRSIYLDDKLPYRDLEINESVRHSKFCLWNYDELISGGRILIVNEGLFDAAKLDAYAPEDVRATCLFTKTIQPEQFLLLMELSKVYEELWIMLDKDASVSGMEIKEELSVIRNARFKLVPYGAKDPGLLSIHQVHNFLE